MGITNFVNNFLSSRQGQRHSQPQQTPSPSDRLPKPSPQNPPRRRRHPPPVPQPYKDEWNADFEPEWLFNDEPISRDFDSRRHRRNNRRPRRHLDEPLSTSSNAFPSRPPLKSFEDDDIPDWHSRPSLPVKDRLDERLDPPASRSRRQNKDLQPGRRLDRDDRETSARRDDRDAPSSRRLSGWRRRTGRVKSNIEESLRTTSEPVASTRFRSPPNVHPASEHDVPVPDSPSLKRLIARSRAAAGKQLHDPTRGPDSTSRIDTVTGFRQIPKRDSSASGDGSLKHSNSARHEGLPKRRGSAGSRIRSNIDQFIRRDNAASDARHAGRRIHSSMNKSAGYVNPSSLSSSEPISLVNESYVSPKPEIPETSLLRPSHREHPPKPPGRPMQTTPPKPPPIPSPNGKKHSRKKKFPLVQDLGDASPMAIQPSHGDGEQPKMRFSAEAVFPSRPRPALPQAFARSQSNPAPPTQPTPPGLRRPHLKRPPPLLTPINGSPGFALGVGADANGIRGLSITRDNSYHSDKLDKERRSIDFPATTSAVTEESDFNDLAGPLEGERKGLPELDDDGIAEPKAYAKSDIWKTNHAKNDGMGTNRIRAGDILGSNAKLSRKLSDREQELFLFEEASQSSFDTDSPSKIAARNGIVPMDQCANAGEVMEDNFVFGADESFSDGGFIISSDGRVDLPEKVTRKMSDGLAVDGVPSSSSNVILVRDLREFRKKYTFKDSRSSKNCNPTLGRGAAGKVYLAVHEPSRLKIAVKEINIFDQDKRDQFKKELVTLIGHQSRFLVRSYGAFYGGNGSVHVALEYMDRGALADIITQMGPIPEAVMRKIAEHCLRGLAFLHENHILHRDVKTGNILLSRKLCRAKLSDFGLARNFKEGREEGESTGDGYSVTHTFVGTVLYMSPERLNGQEYTYASDVWGMGMAILECILGRYPFDKPQSYFDILVSAKSAPHTLMESDNVSDELAQFIALATHNEPDERPTARKLLQSPWIQMGQDNSNVLRDWLDSLPRLHCQNVEVGSELAFGARKKKEAKALAKIRAKAKEANRNM